MKKTLKWRLGKLPTPEEVTSLVKDKIITKEEARQVLFSEENEETGKIENLKKEIQFLRELTEKLSSEESEETGKIENLKKEIQFLRELTEKLSSKSQIIETIRYIEKPYIKYPWYNPYMTWCLYSDGLPSVAGSNTMYLSNSGVAGTNDSYPSGTGGNYTLTSATTLEEDNDFSSIKTF